MEISIAAALLALGLFSGTLLAQSGNAVTNGEVRRIDKAGARITLKHEEIKNLQMPAMTMVFRAPDPSMLDKVKVGDKVKFEAEDVKGALTLRKIEAVR